MPANDVGSAINGNVGYLDPQVTDALIDGTPGILRWRTQPVYAQAGLAFHQRLEDGGWRPAWVLPPGRAQTLKSCAMASEDGGITWQALPNRKLGKIGQYQTARSGRPSGVLTYALTGKPSPIRSR